MSGMLTGVVRADDARRAPVFAAPDGRLRLEHAVATASNGAESYAELAPAVLRLVCEHFGWPSGGLVTCPEGESGVPVVEFGFGDCSSLTLDWVPDRAHDWAATAPAVHAGPGHRVRVVVPLITASDAAARALVFDGPDCGLDAEHLEILRTVGRHVTQVIEREAIAAKLREGEKRFRSVFDRSPLPMSITLGESGTFGIVNDSFCELVGRSAAELLGRSAAIVMHPDDLHLADPAGAAAAAAPDHRFTTIMRFVHASGDVIFSRTTLSWIDGPDGPPNLLAQFEDITARRAAEQEVRWRASHDMLTGLFNRSRLTTELRQLGVDGARVAVLFVDVDAFKLINDTRGHDAGDEVLVGVAERLRHVVRPTDLIARFGGDEFVVVCPLDGSTSSKVAARTAERIGERLATPFETAAGSARVTVSVGVAEGVVHIEEPQRLIQQADAAMNRAKTLGKARCTFYDNELHDRAIERIRTEAALRTALEDDRFVLHLQPIVRLDDSSIVGFEALVRLIDENGTLVPPAGFIAVAEQSGLIVAMGTWVIQHSCRLLAQLRLLTGEPLTISVNIAARQAARPDLASIVIDALQASKLPADALTLELTESALLEADAQTLSQLNMLREDGVGIALDDFGTGYSSLTYLRRLPVSCLKIDRSFVQDMLATPADRAIVRAVANLATDLGLKWIAEGVETVEQRRALQEFGPGLEQGFLFSRPVPFDALVRLLQSQGAAPG